MQLAKLALLPSPLDSWEARRQFHTGRSHMAILQAHDQCWDEHRGPGEICEDAWSGGTLKYNWDWSNDIESYTGDSSEVREDEPPCSL